MRRPRHPLKHPRLVDRICAMLRASGMTQAQMAKRYGVSTSFIETLLAGKHCPNADIAQFIYEDLAGCPLVKIAPPAGKADGAEQARLI